MLKSPLTSILKLFGKHMDEPKVCIVLVFPLYFEFTKIHLFLKQCLHDLHFMKTRSFQQTFPS